MAERVRQIPLLKFVIPYLLGLSLHSFGAYASYALIGLLFLQFFILSLQWVRGVSWFSRAFHSFNLYAMVLTVAMVLGQKSFNRDQGSVEGEFLLELKKHKRGVRYQTYEFKVLRNTGTKQYVNQSAIMLLKAEDSLSLFQLGTRCLYRGQLQSIQGPAHDYAFDFKSYYHSKGVVFRAFPEANQFLKISQNSKADQIGMLGLKNACVSRIEKGFSKEQAGVLSALLLGDRSKLEPKLKQAFIRSGSIHVLAVSGLHIGVVFASIFFLLKSVLGQGFASGIALGVVWVYAFLTGLAPPVIRASLMVSVYVLVRMDQRSRDPLNTVVLCLLLMAMFDPWILRSVGAQLSFTAVISILLAYPLFRKWMRSKDWFVDKLLSMAALSCAAQVLTLPLSLHYFGQFPLHFLLANLSLVPLIVVSFHMGLIWIVLNFLMPVLANGLGYLIDFYLTTAVDLAYFLGSQESLLLNYQIDIPTTFLLVLSGILTLLYPKGFFKLIVPAILLAVSGLCLQDTRKNQLLIYEEKGQCLSLLTQGEYAVCIGSSEQLIDPSFEAHILKKFMLQNHLKKAIRIPQEMLNVPWQIAGLINSGNGHLISAELGLFYINGHPVAALTYGGQIHQIDTKARSKGIVIEM